MILGGKAPHALLKSYEGERRPVGAFNVEWALNAFFNHMLLEMAVVAVHPNNLDATQTPEHVINAYLGVLKDSANGRMRRARLKRVYDTQNIEFYAHDVELGFVYENGALVTDGTSVPAHDPEGGHYRQTSRPGHRLPHCWLSRDGETVSSHDLVGRKGQFALIVRDDGAAWRQVAEDVGRELGLVVIYAQIGRAGNVYDSEGRWPALSETAPDGCILVRPDNIVAWRSHDMPQDPKKALRGALDVILAI
jgi:2,4-dichlorophenol 6-monooxygenase